jgi:hypothetical protein
MEKERREKREGGKKKKKKERKIILACRMRGARGPSARARGGCRRHSMRIQSLLSTTPLELHPVQAKPN